MLFLFWFHISILDITHWGRVTHICVGTLTITGSDNGLSPSRRQAIIWTNAGLLLIGPLGTNFNDILIKILTFSFKKMHLKMSSGKCRPFCPGLNVLIANPSDWQRFEVQPCCLMVAWDHVIPLCHADIWLSLFGSYGEKFSGKTLYIPILDINKTQEQWQIPILVPISVESWSI